VEYAACVVHLGVIWVRGGSELRTRGRRWLCGLWPSVSGVRAVRVLDGVCKRIEGLTQGTHIPKQGPSKAGKHGRASAMAEQGKCGGVNADEWCRGT